MKYPKHVWDQLKGKAKEKIVKALLKDGFVFDDSSGAIRTYRHPDGRRVTIHYHPKEIFGAGLLKKLIRHIGWTIDDLRRVKLIK